MKIRKIFLYCLLSFFGYAVIQYNRYRYLELDHESNNNMAQVCDTLGKCRD